MKIDIHQEITNKIIHAIKKGVAPWQKPWKTGFSGLPTRANGEQYSGINVLVLWMQADEKGYSNKHWFTFQQAKKLGAMVRKGEKSTKVVFYSTFEKEIDGKEDPQKIPFLKSYSVFNGDQIEDLPEKFQTAATTNDNGPKTAPIPDLEKFFASIGAKILTDGNQAYYMPGVDQIRMPAIEKFNAPLGYYQTLSHEIIHWTGAKSRLDRNHSPKRKDYAFEELIAEIGSCFLGAQIGIAPDINNSASYVDNWLAALKGDKKFIFQAASAAQKASQFVLDCAKSNAGTAPEKSLFTTNQNEVTLPPVVAAPVAAGQAQMVLNF